MVAAYLVIAAVCFVLFYIMIKMSNFRTELYREPVFSVAFILGLLGPIIIVVAICYFIYAYTRYKMNSRK